MRPLSPEERPYDRRVAQLEVEAAELGWDGATTRVERCAAPKADTSSSKCEASAEGNDAAMGAA